MLVKLGAFAFGVSGVIAVGSVVLALAANNAWIMFLILAVFLAVLGKFVR